MECRTQDKRARVEKFMKTEVHITVYTVVYSAVRNILYSGIEKVTREANEVETTFHQYVICF